MTTLRIVFVCDAAAPIAVAHRALLDERLSAYQLDIHTVRTASVARNAIRTRIVHVLQCEARFVARCANSIRLRAAVRRRCAGFGRLLVGTDTNVDEDASSEAWTRLIADGSRLVVATVSLEPLHLAPSDAADSVEGDADADVCMLLSDPFALDAFCGVPPDDDCDFMN